MSLINAVLLHFGILKDVNDPSIQKDNSKLPTFPGYYKFLYWVYLIPFLILLFFVLILTFISPELLQRLWFAPDSQTIIVNHSSWIWAFKFIAILGAIPLSVAIYYPFYRLVFPDDFREYVDLRMYAVGYLRGSQPWLSEARAGNRYKRVEKEVFATINVAKLRHSYRPLNIFFCFVFIIGFIAYILAINSYTTITPNQIVVHDFWKIQPQTLSYDTIKIAKLTYDPASNIFWPKFTLEFDNGQDLTIWGINTDIEDQDFQTIIKYLTNQNIKLEATSLKSIEITESNQKSVSQYKNFFSIINNTNQ